ncbi:MAG: hypothetical protein AB7T63_17360 [Planctomycetota bacterium]
MAARWPAWAERRPVIPVGETTAREPTSKHGGHMRFATTRR